MRELLSELRVSQLLIGLKTAVYDMKPTNDQHEPVFVSLLSQTGSA